MDNSFENQTNNKLPEFKIVFVGNESVGKTSIINRFYNNVFVDQHQPTIGGAYVSKEVECKYGRAFLHLWDTAGQERYRCLVPMYSRGATVCVIVFDITDKPSFDEIPYWIQNVHEISSDIEILYVGNKIDLNQKETSFLNDVGKWASENNIEVLYTSAKTGENIDILFKNIVSLLPQSAFMKKKSPIDNPPPINDINNSSGCC